jgi:hypothetical protein
MPGSVIEFFEFFHFTYHCGNRVHRRSSLLCDAGTAGHSFMSVQISMGSFGGDFEKLTFSGQQQYVLLLWRFLKEK